VDLWENRFPIWIKVCSVRYFCPPIWNYLQEDKIHITLFLSCQLSLKNIFDMSMTPLETSLCIEALLSVLMGRQVQNLFMGEQHYSRKTHLGLHTVNLLQLGRGELLVGGKPQDPLRVQITQQIRSHIWNGYRVSTSQPGGFLWREELGLQKSCHSPFKQVIVVDFSGDLDCRYCPFQCRSCKTTITPVNQRDGLINGRVERASLNHR
jgi:hypothetical protein